MTAPMSEGLAGPALLFCPGDRPERFDKAAAAADAVILDLEDAVAPDAKAAARRTVADAFVGGRVDPRRTLVRVNPLDTQWGGEDVAVLRESSVPTVVLPKAADPADLARLEGFAVLALCETAAGILAAEHLAAAPNCVGLMWGGEDLTADLGGRSSRGPGGGYLPHVVDARVRILLAAAAHGRTAVDGVFLDYRDTEGLAQETSEGVAMGFDAKATIHPGQVATVRAAFRPSRDQVDWAREVVEAVERGGVATVRGRMVDEPLLRQARTLLAAAAGAEATA